jgi:hypothetical protein
MNKQRLILFMLGKVKNALGGIRTFASNGTKRKEDDVGLLT